MSGMFDHTFQHALLGVGAFLAFAGAAFAFFNAGSALGGGLAEALSYGFAAFFISLFSGVLIGVGIAMVADSLILGLKSNKVHVAVAVGFSVLSLLIAAGAAADAQFTSFHTLVIFFAGLCASGAFLLSAAVFGFSALFHSFITRAQAEEGSSGQAKAGGKARR